MTVFQAQGGPRAPVEVDNALHLVKTASAPQTCTQNGQTSCFQFPLSFGLLGSPMTTTATSPRRPFKLHPTVVLSYPDVRLAGLRTLHGFTPYATDGPVAGGRQSTTQSGTSAEQGGARESSIGGAQSSAGGSGLNFLPPCFAPSLRAAFGCGAATVELDSAVYVWRGPGFIDSGATTPSQTSPKNEEVGSQVQVVAADQHPADTSSAFQFPGVSVPSTGMPSAVGSTVCLLDSQTQSPGPGPSQGANPLHNSNASKPQGTPSSSPTKSSSPIQIHVLNVVADWAETEKVSLVQITGLPESEGIPWFADALLSWFAQGGDDGLPCHNTSTLSSSPSTPPKGTSQVRRVIIVAAADFKPNRDCDQLVHAIGAPFMESLVTDRHPSVTSPSLPALAASTPIHDPFLNTFCSLLTVQGIPFTGLVYPAKRIGRYPAALTSPTQSEASNGNNNNDDDSVDVLMERKHGSPVPVTDEDRRIVQALCNELDTLTGLPFDARKGCQIRLRYKYARGPSSGREQLLKDSFMYL
ncbi:hypothetical protein IWQ62_001026 [Dispira parvispora]|uniref:Uncharacterized protein n=1 Tax=Dispira parvispora TaxID=1520584 RepID=A0A9W8ATI7_9FUNG|nr:hypothetical protein IWQ62_001026 [Dispira parvispora]